MYIYILTHTYVCIHVSTNVSVSALLIIGVNMVCRDATDHLSELVF